MSIQISCNLSVAPDATPAATLTIDNGHVYPLTVESPTRGFFLIPGTEPSPYGAAIAYGSKSLRLLVPPPGAYELTDPRLEVTPPTTALVFGPPPSREVQIVGDHFELDGQRWTWRMTTGFCDYKVFLDGGDLRSLLKQNQDLGVRGRRVLPHIVNIVDFNPDVYAAKGYWERLPEYLAVNAEYEQDVDFPVLSDTGYRNWPLGKCQDFWARFVDTVRPATNRFVNLTNEFDHGGNLVGTVNDYARPAGLNVSQGSATQDQTPPSPGWGYREWHAADEPTKFTHEYYIWKGLSTGGTPKATVITEHGRRITEQNADADYIRTLAYSSLANGCGLTVHTEDGKYSRLFGARQAGCVKTAMDILALGQ